MIHFQMRNLPARARLTAAVAIGCAALSGCMAKNSGPVTSPAAPVTVYVPNLTPQGGTQMSQTKGGLTIAIAPAPFTTVVTTTTNWTSRPQQLSDGLLLGSSTQDPPVFATKTTASVPVVRPNQLSFLVTINNQMPRVFHGTGTVIQFNVGGHLLSVDQKLYADLQNAIVPPNNQAQIHIFGPTLDELPPDTKSVSLSFYDVVTEQNDAGVVTAKQNYQWDFALSMEPRTVQVPGTVTEGKLMTSEEFQRHQSEDAMPHEAPASGGMPGALPDPGATPG